MGNPFHIFPSIGYKNSQFQLKSNIDDIIVEIQFNDKIVHQIKSDTTISQLILNLNQSGTYTARCFHQNSYYEQKIEVKDSIRLGASEFKKAFVFDNCEFSFFSMKDRLLIYDEKLKELYTENAFNPSSIQHIEKEYYLFKTNIGSGNFSITNFEIYDINSFSIVKGILHDFLELHLDIKLKLLWVYNRNEKSIICYELVSKNGGHLVERLKFERISNYFVLSGYCRLFAQSDTKLLLIDLSTLNFTFRNQKENTALDKNGNYYEIEGSRIVCKNYFNNESLEIEKPESLNLSNTEDFFYVGSGFQIAKPNLEDLAEVKDKITAIDLRNTALLNPITINFDESEILNSSYTCHNFYNISKGLVIKTKIEYSKIIGFTPGTVNKRTNSSLVVHTRFTYINELYLGNNIKKEIEKQQSNNLFLYENNTLVTKYSATFTVYYRETIAEFKNLKNILLIKRLDKEFIISEHLDNSFSVYSIENLFVPILGKVIIYNLVHVELHGTVWYSGVPKDSDGLKSLNMFSLDSNKVIELNENKAEHSKYKDASEYIFLSNYIKSSNGIIINPTSGKIGKAFNAPILTLSENHNKVITLRGFELSLWITNNSFNEYKEYNIRPGLQYFSESYLSPDGRFLVLRNKSNQYSWYNLEKNEITNFDSGSFISFTKEGNMLVEDKTRKVKIIDPLTFNEITPPNYQYYKFLSPDGKLYAELGEKFKYFNKITKEILSEDEILTIRKDLNSQFQSILTLTTDAQKIHLEDLRVDYNKLQYYNKYKSFFESNNLYDYKNLSPDHIIGKQYFVIIGIVGTDVKVEVLFPLDHVYYNYAVFSHDSRYFAWVGKTSFSGIVRLYKVEFDAIKELLSLDKEFIHLLTSKATWVCGFSSNGYFAAYDSIPVTYLLQVKDENFSEITSGDNVSQENLFNRIYGRNFLCFSPSGKYMALSEQGYRPYSLGGSGHQESNALHILNTLTEENIISFEEHGEIIKVDQSKKVVFVAFSADEKKLMSLSSDGVVIVRDVDLN